MAKYLVMVEVRGQRSSWCVKWHASQEQIDAMREDGVDVGVIENIIPSWVANAGLARSWVFLQDVWNLQNPFRQFKQ